MSKAEATWQDFIMSVFSTNVAVLCTHQVEILSQKNRLSFVEILQSFSHLFLDAQIKDPLTNINNIRRFNLNFIEMKNQCVQPLIAKKLLNESVSKYITSFSDDDSLTIQNHALGNMHDIYSQYELKKGIARTITEDELYKIEYPLTTPWFDDYRRTFFQVMLCGDHEYLRHFIACLFVVSTNAPNPLLEMESLVKQQHEHQHQTQAQPNILSQSLTNLSSAGHQSSLSHSGTTSNRDTNFHGQNYHHNRPTTATVAYSNKWFCPNVFHFHVLLHDPAEVDDTKANSIYENMKNMYGSHSCHFLRINDDSMDNTSEHDLNKNTKGITNNHEPQIQMKDVENALVEAATTDIPNNQDVTLHPLSNHLDGHIGSHEEGTDFPENVIIDNNRGSSIIKSGLTPISLNDAKHIRNLLTEFCIKGLFPWAERQLRLWNEQLQSKKGIHKSLITATKKWFSSGKPPTSGIGQASSTMSVLLNFESNLEALGAYLIHCNVINYSGRARYSAESPELQMRHLADLAFLFQCYPLAYSFYHSVKRDFQSDQAWIYYAGAVEMAAISAFMSGSNVTNYPFHYMDSAINTYLSVCNLPIFATRATLISTEILKSLGLYADAAMQFVRLTTEESDLRSALFLEQSALCFVKIKNPMIRKYGYHMVLAGNRYFKANSTNLRSHGLRCYTLAWDVYNRSLSWTLARDHVAFTLARQWLLAVTAPGHKQSLTSSHVERSLSFFEALFTRTSSQSATLQTNFFKEFTCAYNINHPDYCFEMPIPSIDCQNIRISLPEYYNGLTPCEGATPESKDLEKLCYRTVLNDENRDIPQYFSAFYDRTTPNDYPSNVFAQGIASLISEMCEEQFHIEIPIYNAYKIPLIVSNLRLVGHFTEPGLSQTQPTTPNVLTYHSTFMTDGIKTQHTWDERIAGIKTNIYKPYIKDPSHNNIGECMSLVQPEGDVFISPLESKIVTFVVEPRLAGLINIVGLSYSLVFPFATSPSPSSPILNGDVNQQQYTNPNNLGSFKSSIPFRQTLWCQGRRLNDSISQHKNPTYSIDERLKILVRPALPYMKLDLKNFPSHLYDSQICEGIIMVGVLQPKSQDPSHTPNYPGYGLLVATNNPLTLMPLPSNTSPLPRDGNGEVLYHQEGAVENFKMPLVIHNSAQARLFYRAHESAENLPPDNGSESCGHVTSAQPPTQLKCDIVLVIYQRYQLSHGTSCVNYRLHRLSLDIKTEPSLNTFGVYNKSQNHLGNVNARVNFENLTKETDDKIMEIHLRQILFVSDALTFSPCVPVSSQIPKEMTASTEESTKDKQSKALKYSDPLSAKMLEPDDVVHKNYIFKLLDFLSSHSKFHPGQVGSKIIVLVYWKGLLVDEKGATENIQGIYSIILDEDNGKIGLQLANQNCSSAYAQISRLLNYQLECPIVQVQSNHMTSPISEDVFSYVSYPPALITLRVHLKNLSAQFALRVDVRALNFSLPVTSLDQLDRGNDIDKYNTNLIPSVLEAYMESSGAKLIKTANDTINKNMQGQKSVSADIPLLTSPFINELTPLIGERGYIWVGATDVKVILAPCSKKIVELQAFFPSGLPGAYQIKDLLLTVYVLNHSNSPGRSIGQIFLGNSSSMANKSITDAHFIQIENDPFRDPKNTKRTGKIINI